MTFSPLGAYIPGRSILHRMRPGAKLLGLFVFATAAIALRSVPSTAVALALAITASVIAGLRPRDFLRITTRFAVIAVILFAFQAWQNGWERGFAVVGTLFALILAASALTATTATQDTAQTITWALGPLRRFGVAPERVALALSLVLRTIPTVLGLAHDTREAARARGLARHPRAYLVPLVLRTISYAHLTGEALTARGITDDRAHDPRSSRS